MAPWGSAARRTGASLPSRALTTLLATVTALALATAPAVADAPRPGDPHDPTLAGISDAAPTAVPEVSIPTARLHGASRVETAVAISKSAFSAGADTVYLARSDVFADAIAAGSLTDGPVLLVPRCGTIPRVVLDEIARVDPAEVVALGGPDSVCQETVDTAATGRTATRLGGVDRYDTAALIADRAFPEGATTVYLAEQRESADAVAGGVLTDGPILLVANGSDTVPPQTLAAIGHLDPSSVVALGGPASVTAGALKASAGTRHTDRVAGADRFATSAAIADRAFPKSSSRTYLASGTAIADAVVGGSLTRGPILLVRNRCAVVTEPVWRRLSTQPPEMVVALGGTNSVCAEQLETAARLSVLSGMETDDKARLYDLLTKTQAVSPLHYVPADLVSWRGTGHQVRPEVSVMLDALFDDAAAAGRPGLYVKSAYRSYAEQQATYDYWVRTVGRARADVISAKPGHSEHQLGLAVDLGGPNCTGWACFGDTPEGRWVAAHAHEYGFIIRYPEGGTSVTGYEFEPWHLRYVGPRAAWMMHVRDRIYWDTYQPTAVADGTL